MSVVHQLKPVLDDLVRPDQELELRVLEELLDRLASELNRRASGEVKSDPLYFFCRVRPKHVRKRVKRLVVIKLRLLWVSETVETVYHIHVKARPAGNTSVHDVV